MSGRALVLVILMILPPSGLAHAMSKLMIEQAWTRATLGPASAAAVFLRIDNHGSEGDRLIGARASLAEKAELHRHVRNGQFVRTFPIEAIDVPAGGSVVLAPDGPCIMLFNLNRSLKTGTRFEIALEFEHAGTVPVSVRVAPLGSKGPAAGSAAPLNHAAAAAAQR